MHILQIYYTQLFLINFRFVFGHNHIVFEIGQIFRSSNKIMYEYNIILLYMDLYTRYVKDS